MNEPLDFKDSCTFYPTTVDDYGHQVLGQPVGPVPCLFIQTTGYQHSGSQDAIVGSSRLILPPDNEYLLGLGYRLEEQIVEVNLFGASSAAQRFKVTNVTPERDTLLDNDVRQVGCDLKKVQTGAYVS